MVIPMDQQWHDHRALVGFRMMLILLGAHFAERDRVDDFQMRWICSQRQMNFVVVELSIG